MKILFYDAKNYDKESFQEALTNYPGISIEYFETDLSEKTAIYCKGYDAVCAFVNSTLDRKVLQILVQNNVRLVLMRCAGFNNVDMEEAEKLGVTIMTVPAYSPEAVAEHAMALALAANRRIHKAYIKVRENNFSLQGLAGFDLYGKTVGIIGTGKIGRVFADICKGFGMNVLAYDKFPAANSGLNYVELPELFEKSDIISLHCPLTEETRHIINAESIAMMKKGVTIINTSRGALVNTEDLITGIKDRKVGAACLDVYEEEGDLFYEDYSGHIVEDDKLVRLIAMPNVIVTSHQAFLTNEALDNIAATTVNNLTRFFSGDPDTTTEVCYHK